MTDELRIGVPNPGREAFKVTLGEDELAISVRQPFVSRFGARVADDELSLWALPFSQGGETIYEWHQNGWLRVEMNPAVMKFYGMKLLMVGGGGSGGGGICGGGGGGGGFAYWDNVFNSSEPGDRYFKFRTQENAVYVGLGGGEVPNGATTGFPGLPSEILDDHEDGYTACGRTMHAIGGGYGGANTLVDRTEEVNYDPGDGASGGGGRMGDIEYLPRTSPRHYYSKGGNGDSFDNQGYPGGRGDNWSAWYNHSAGGGGGAGGPGGGIEGEPYQHNGGVGRQCDILAGTEGYGELLNYFAGGGGGGERENNWGYVPGSSGKGTIGRGGKGASAYSPEHYGDAPGPAGNDGIVVIRLSRAYDRFITVDGGCIVTHPRGVT